MTGTSSFTVAPVRPFGVMLRPRTEGSSVLGLPVDHLRELTRQHHLVVLRGFATFDGAEPFADYCGRLGEVSLWPFGKVLELVEQANPQDHIFDNNYVPLHWDGMYRPQVPEFQVFHCVSAPLGDQGGRTTFSDTTVALGRADRRLRALWEGATGVYHRKMEYYDSQTVAPVVTPHPVRGFPVIRYCEIPLASDASFINHPSIRFEGVRDSELVDFHRGLREALYAPECFYAHAWQTGDLVLTDNYTLLHGRDAFTSGAPRHLRRVHVLGDPPLINPHLVTHA
jgi:alpha-ketoglutarate-dependent taurine dioxygenase